MLSKARRCPEVVPKWSPGCYETFLYSFSKDIFNYNATNRTVIVSDNILSDIYLFIVSRDFVRS